MLRRLDYTVSPELLQEAINNLPDFDRRINLNVKTGNFFYDKWIISPEFKNTVWERILNTLPMDIGEARLMKLQPEQCYRSHADLDDRYHLSLIESRSYLVDLDEDKLYPIKCDGYWYEMDAGRRHSAVNFGGNTRVQLVIRTLLVRGTLLDPRRVIIKNITPTENNRFIFDDVFSPVISKINKMNKMDYFTPISDTEISFMTERNLVDEFKKVCPPEFEVHVE